MFAVISFENDCMFINVNCRQEKKVSKKRFIRKIDSPDKKC